MPRAAGVAADLREVFFFFLRAVLVGVAAGLREVFFFLRAVLAGADRFEVPERFGSGLVLVIRQSLSKWSWEYRPGPGATFADTS